MTPYSITRYYNGEMSNQRFLNTVTYNNGLNDSMFTAKTTYDPTTPAAKEEMTRLASSSEGYAR